MADFLDIRHGNHSTIAIQELMHTVGMLDPAHKGTKIAIQQIRTTVKAMPAHRVFTPDADVLGRAALLSGMLCRLQGYHRDARLKALHDCVQFLQAQKMGLAVLTAGRVLFYRSAN